MQYTVEIYHAHEICSASYQYRAIAPIGMRNH